MQRREARTQHICKIKESLRSLPLLSRNVSLVNNKALLSEFETKQDPKVRLEHIDVFEQKYRMEDKIGEGANGIVRRCIKRKNNKTFAVKCMMVDEEQVIELRSNFRAVRSLNHPSVVKYFALYVDMSKHMCYLVMEYVPHPSPPAHLDTSSLREMMRLLLQALAYLHSQGMVHRDIKIQNILYNPAKQQIKLIDFGLCRRHRRQMITVTGTLFYRAPQMFIGGGYSEAVDVWAAGILLYKLISGTTPFESEYLSQTIRSITTLQPTFDRFNDVSSSVKHLLKAILHKNPYYRPSAQKCLKHQWFRNAGDQQLPFLQYRLSNCELSSIPNSESGHQASPKDYFFIDSDDEMMQYKTKHKGSAVIEMEFDSFVL